MTRSRRHSLAVVVLALLPPAAGGVAVAALGLLGILIEIRTPGFGVPGILDVNGAAGTGNSATPSAASITAPATR